MSTATTLVRGGGRLVECRSRARSPRSPGTGGRHLRFVDLLSGRQFTVHHSHVGSRADTAEVLESARAGKLAPVVDSVMPLAEARRAHGRMEASEHFGKIVLVP